jgi:hypothetical protein
VNRKHNPKPFPKAITQKILRIVNNCQCCLRGYLRGISYNIHKTVPKKLSRKRKAIKIMSCTCCRERVALEKFRGERGILKIIF